MAGSYRATKLVSVAEGPMYGPGEDITGKFDPKQADNAQLIADGLIVDLGAEKSAKHADTAKEKEKGS